MSKGLDAGGSSPKNSLWNLLYRVVSSTDRTRTSWIGILRGSCLAFFKETVDDLPGSDNEEARVRLKSLFFDLPGHRVYDFLEFLLADDRAGLKEADRKLIRRRLNEILDEEGAPVRLLRDRFVPLPDMLGMDAVAAAEGKLTLFDMAAASRHLDASLAYLSRRPEAAARDAVREAVLAVAAVVRTLREGTEGIAVGTIEPVAGPLGIGGLLEEGAERLLRRAHAASGLPGASSGEEEVSSEEASFLVVFCSSLINLLLARDRSAPPAG